MKFLQCCFFIPAILAVAKSCTSDSDCDIANTICSEEKCICKKGFVMSSDNSCLPYVTEYLGECSEEVQCEWLGDNSECKNVCRCKEGYRWYKGECKAYVGLGQQCTQNEDCFDGYNFESLQCSDSVCACSKGFYQRGDIDCRKVATNLNDSCALDLDCHVPDKDTICHIGKCQLPDAKALFEEEEIEDKILFVNKESAISCASEEDCSFDNSECYDKTGTCICKKGYFFDENGTSCIAEIGIGTCTEDKDCPLKPGKCVNGVCYCRDYYFVDESNRKCVKSMNQNNTNCLTREWCFAWGFYSYCSSQEICVCSNIADFNDTQQTCIKTKDKPDDMCIEDYECGDIENGFCVDEKCGCKTGYALENNTCLPEIGTACDGKYKCVSDDASCVNGFCECNQNYVHEDNRVCYLEKKLGEDCEVNLQCSTVTLYSQCKNKTCACLDTHIVSKGTCYPRREYLSYCNNLYECQISLGTEMGIQCRNNKCQCPTFESLNEDKICSSGMSIVGNIFIVVLAFLLKSYCQ